MFGIGNTRSGSASPPFIKSFYRYFPNCPRNVTPVSGNRTYWANFHKHNNMENKNSDILLFSGKELRDITVKPELLINVRNRLSRHRKRKIQIDNLDICMSLDHCIEGMPRIQAYHGPLPSSLIPFHQANSSSNHMAGVHFYIDDYLFERIWNNPRRYIPMLRQYLCVIGPDFSQYSNMPYALRYWNCYRNRVLTAYLQRNGVRIIPNVTWSLPDSYEYSFCGMPRNSIIAINCTGVISHNASKYLWYKGYNEALRRLSPEFIIRYGTIMPEERKDISLYFENERLKSLRYGR